MISKSILFIGNHFNNKLDFTYLADELVDRLNKDGWVTLKASKYHNKLIRILDMLSTILLKSRKYKVAEVDVFSGHAFFWAEASTQLLHLLKKPTILTLHGGNLPAFSESHPGRTGKLLRMANTVVTPSAYLQKRLKHFRENIQIIPNPIEIEKYPFHIRGNPTPKLIWLRAFHAIYNPSMAIHVLSQLQPKGKDIFLTMVGPDKKDGSLIELTALAQQFNITENLSIPGVVPRSQVPDWLNKNDIFLNTTNIDNTPVSVIEAMACGLCIVSTNVGGIPYLLEDGIDALLVPPGDAPAMAAAVNQILSDPSLAKKLSVNARKKAETFSWDIVYPQWVSLLDGILD
jgi:glycosyltransferase involved in cell wall biosynthesis